jgi:hypothetical protein
MNDEVYCFPMKIMKDDEENVFFGGEDFQFLF